MATKAVRKEISLVFDKFLQQQEQDDVVLTRGRCPSDVVADGVSDSEEHSLEADSVDGIPAGRLDPDQERATIEIASALRHIAEEYNTGGYPRSETKTRRFSLTDIRFDDIKQLVDTKKFNEYMEKHVNSHDPNLRQVAQVYQVTGGLIRLCRMAHEAVGEFRENAENFVSERYGDWIASEGGMTQAVRNAQTS
ncbi:uncharacterized protein LOC135488197 [Lineus longissimus]|uniref:uncharacterized protein LOC135488197 n=1 Tax=Lineus longissimus TaxID=88925 RepID=UPI002B4EA51B